MYDKGGELALQEISGRNPILKNRVEEHIERAVVELALEKPVYGQVRVSNELAKRGHLISAVGVRCVWMRTNLQTFQRRTRCGYSVPILGGTDGTWDQFQIDLGWNESVFCRRDVPRRDIAIVMFVFGRTSVPLAMTNSDTTDLVPSPLFLSPGRLGDGLGRNQISRLGAARAGVAFHSRWVR
jgi:hypothetical protein